MVQIVIIIIVVSFLSSQSAFNNTSEETDPTTLSWFFKFALLTRAVYSSGNTPTAVRPCV